MALLLADCLEEKTLAAADSQEILGRMSVDFPKILRRTAEGLDDPRRLVEILGWFRRVDQEV